MRAPRTSRERLLAAAAAALLVLLAVLVDRGLRKGGVIDPSRTNDFRAYYLAARGALEGDLVPSYGDPERPNQYPPAFGCLAAPLGLLPYRAAAAVWVILNAALVVWIFRGLDSILGLPLGALPRMAGFLLVYRLLESDFSNGNANVLVLALTLASFRVSRTGRDVPSGCVLSAAILTKVTPILVLPWAVLRRRWRACLGTAAGLVVLGALLPALVLGPRGAGEAWSAWYGTLKGVDPLSGEPGQASGYEPGQSLRALLHRLLRRSDATAHDDEAISVHITDLPRPVVEGIYIALAAVILGTLLAASWRRAPGVKLGWGASEIAAACAAMALLAPLSRKAHFVLLWPAAVLGFEAWRRSEGRRLRAAGAALWFGALALVAGTSPGLVGRELATLLLAYCPMAWAAMLLLVLVSWPGFFPRGGRKAADVIRERRGCG